MRVRPFIFSFFLAIGLSAQAETAKSLYLRCIRANESEPAFSKCIGQGIRADRIGLARDFAKLLGQQEDYVLTRSATLVDSNCRMASLQFIKEGSNIRLTGCDARGQCETLSHTIGVMVDQDQYDEISNELFKQSQQNHLVLISTTAPEIEQSCASPNLLCYKLLAKFAGFSPVVDGHFGKYGTQVSKVDAGTIDWIQNSKPHYLLETMVEYVAPASIFIERLPQMFSNRGTSVVADVIDWMASESSMRQVIFNIQFNNILKTRLEQFVSSRSARTMTYSFIKNENVCADEVYQLNHARRGLSIDEALLTRTKDESGDLVHTVGNGLKAINPGFIYVIRGFVKDQVNNP